MFKQVTHDWGMFRAIDEMGRKVSITESIAFIFEVRVAKDDTWVDYSPVDFRQTEILEEIENYLRGVSYDTDVIDTIVIRYGWMDKRLNKLSFIPLTTFMETIRGMYKDRLPTATDQRKLTAVCKQLSLSLKAVKK